MLHRLTRHKPRKDEIGFFLLWLRQPRRLGAVFPSGQSLARAMAAHIDRHAPGVVVELGGGTGSITKAVLQAGIAPKDLIVVEREAKLCRVISQRYPGVRVLCADAKDTQDIVIREGIGPVKTIVSGLPLVAMDKEDCQRILAGAFSVLSPDGEFLQFTYSPASPVSKKMQNGLGIGGKRSRWVLSNLPPAAIWHYRRAA